MLLKSGATLGVYRVGELLGKGGMGEVYRAHDAKLGRDVALKVLPDEFASDPSRFARFEREARLLASLNHPNIAAIYGLEEASETRFLVLELVEGDTLAERLRRPLPVEQALRLAVQIAIALETAHAKGIIHRDLKPANIRITPDGVLKVLDFGLAKAGEPAVEMTDDSPTILSNPGMILGTAGYMSPEQARGQAVDKRTDIWAFGVVLCEMATGKRLFNGDSVSDVLAAVLKNEPDLSAVPQKLRRLLQRCLEKDPKKRLRDIGDWRELLEEPAPTVTRRSALPWAVGAAVLVILASTALYLLGPRPEPPETRLEIVTPPTN